MILRSLVIVAIAMLAVSPIRAAAQTGTDVVLDWNAIMVSTVSGQNPFAQARFAAITQLAVFEAVNSITGEYEPYFNPIDAPGGSSPEAAAAKAAHDVLVAYFPAAGTSLDSRAGLVACGHP